MEFLFWGLFAGSDPDNANIVIENIDADNDNSVINEHYLTEAVGYYSFALYMVLTVIVILNMMIGTMANTYQRVIDNVSVEWVYGQTEVYLAYTQQTVLPAPFNLLPMRASRNSNSSPRGYFDILFGGSKEKNLEDECIEEQRNNDYPDLMTNLVQRYFRLGKRSR